MFSLNVPLPGEVKRQVESLRPALSGFETIRTEPTLVVKRFGRPGSEDIGRIESESRAALAGEPAFEARLDGLGCFEDPPSGPAPVVYLAIESPGLIALHERLVEVFDAVDDLEGESYVPHITLARGGAPAAFDGLDDVAVESVTWTVSELWFWDARHGERAGRASLPG